MFILYLFLYNDLLIAEWLKDFQAVFKYPENV